MLEDCSPLCRVRSEWAPCGSHMRQLKLSAVFDLQHCVTPSSAGSPTSLAGTENTVAQKHWVEGWRGGQH